MQRKSTRIAIAAALLLAAIGIAACGGSGSGQVIARVGEQTITKGQLDRYLAYLQREGGISVQSASAKRALRAQALGTLISGQWLIGEAASRGAAPSKAEVQRQMSALAGTTTGQNAAEVKLQAQEELARAKLRQLALANVPKVSSAEIAAYYASHKHDYFVPGRREARFTNRKTRAQIEKLKKEVEAGKSLTAPDQVETGELYAGAHVPPGRGDPYEAAIDSAKPHTLAGPFKIYHDEWLYEVVKVVQPHQRPLAEVSGAIAHKLSEERTQAALSAFVKALGAQWTSKTDCDGGYLAPGCRQYRGAGAGQFIRL